MNVSFYNAAMGLAANQQWQETIVNNLASSSQPGFRKEEIAFSSMDAGKVSGTGNNTASAESNVYVPFVRKSVNFTRGETKYTGDPTDVAIKGAGFFEIELPDGSTGYTRRGEFKVSTQGELVTLEGYRVLGDGAPIQLDINNKAPVSIQQDGRVMQGGIPRGNITLVDFNNPGLLTPISGSCFIAADQNLLPVPVDEPNLQQGLVETANTTPVAEMANLMTALRAYETNQKVIQTTDERLSKTIAQLGTPS
ncbi:MAG: flagellar hook-basal body protein [Verrucomicrobia bacterium]|nr:flagellar hook-basal body protein [Verrucomicrobiota bacterium]MCF7707918.1 flagellar hook-basal body protein [Verrucomicrobiota bacterium]